VPGADPGRGPAPGAPGEGGQGRQRQGRGRHGRGRQGQAQPPGLQGVGAGQRRRSSTAPGNDGTATGEREGEGNVPPWGRRCVVAGVEEMSTGLRRGEERRGGRAPVEWRGR
jgi:hypothetical protein